MRVATVTAAAVADRPGRDGAAGVVGDRGHRRVHRGAGHGSPRALFAGGYWLNLSQPVLASSLALFGGVGYQYFVEGREKRKMKKLFGQYVSKDVCDQLVANPELARLGGHRREMTVLFSDIRGFTTLTERGQPEEIVGMLNEYFTRMVEIVFRHHGTLDKFVGDMVMALFGAPLDDPDHADHAVEAALEMLDELCRAQRALEGRRAVRELDIGIGINTGPMIAGNIGSEAIMSYTVIGDAVNLGVAARIAEQGVRHPDYHQRDDARPARAAVTVFARSATSSSRARPSRSRSSS